MRIARVVSYTIVGALIVAEFVHQVWWWVWRTRSARRWRKQGDARAATPKVARVAVLVVATTVVCIVAVGVIIRPWPVEEAPVVVQTPRDTIVHQAMSGRAPFWIYHDSADSTRERVPVLVLPDSLEDTQ